MRFLGLLLAVPASALCAPFVTSAEFAVSDGGAATLSVPLQVPRGIGGMEPKLALNYASGTSNGLLGWGWSLAGPSAITRCPKTRLADGVRGAVSFTTADRFCLDGQRLETVDTAANTDALYGAAGAEYRTERDSFARIKAVGQWAPGVPLGFRVETKSGLVLEFGLSDNSRALTNIAPGLGSNTINRWMLQRISDRTAAASFVEFVYCGGKVSADGATCTVTEGTPAWSGSKPLHTIRYTNRHGTLNGENGVVFGYEDRPDAVRSHFRGASSRQTQRMVSIESFRAFSGPALAQRGTLVRGYDLVYEPLVNAAGQSLRATNVSRIAEIRERTADRASASVSAGTALPPLKFTLAPDRVFGQVVAHSDTTSTTLPTSFIQSGCGGVLPNRLKSQCP